MGKRFETVRVDRTICSGASCDNCGIELKPAMQDSNGCACFDGLLNIKIDGPGYGEFMDGEPPIHGILCATCAREFLQRYPFMKGLEFEPKSELDEDWVIVVED